MGVRYNAEKKKIGNYYSTPIYSFRCKCHLCDGWFEIQTDPKNTRYVVTSGARQKEEDWNPEENGGFAVHDTDASSAPVDPLAALEKTTDAQNHLTKVQVPRLESLQVVSDQFNADPYTLSLKARKRFREEKKVEKAKQKADDAVRGKYGLPSELRLLEDDDTSIQAARGEWQKAKQEHDMEQRSKRRKLGVDVVSIPSVRSGAGSSSKPTGAISSLRARILENTARQSNPFGKTRTSISRISGVGTGK